MAAKWVCCLRCHKEIQVSRSTDPKDWYCRKCIEDLQGTLPKKSVFNRVVIIAKGLANRI